MAARISMPIVLETREVEPGRLIAGVFAEGLKGVWEWRFVPTDLGTRVETNVEYELPLGILGQLADRMLVERENQTNVERTLAILKAKVEVPKPAV